MQFTLSSKFKPTGDQPQAITSIVQNLQKGQKDQVLLGVTGSGKTFTMANVIAKTQLPTLVISHNKTLAGQLYQEFRDFFPQNGVSYFVSYYDYYQPEAYIPTTDTYIEKETDINDEIEKLRLLATTNLQTRNDVIVVASVSCIYNLGNPEEYAHFAITVRVGAETPREQFLKDLVRLQYERSDYETKRGNFRVKGDTIELWPAYTDELLRLEFFGNKLEKLYWVDPVSGLKVAGQADLAMAAAGKESLQEYLIFPAKHYLTDPERQKPAMEQIRTDLKLRLKELKNRGKIVEAMRLDQKVNYDLDMITELGFVNGIENYSRYFDGRAPGEPPYTLLDFFEQKKEWLLIIDESHMTIPQIRGMYNGDQARKQTLIDYGFRLPSALDNRPLQFNEFLAKTPKTVYVSATPADWEIERSKGAIVEQLIRPTGLIDPEIEVRPTQNQIQDLTLEIMKRKAKGQRVLVTTLTKKLAEALTEYLNEEENISNVVTGGHLSLQANSPDPSLEKRGNAQADTTTSPFGEEELKGVLKPKVAYLHSDIDTLDRQDILDDLRKGEYDVLIGINLLREGLDLPEVSLVAILDADKEGFLRSRTSLIQTMGRAARHVEGQIIMYADQMTGSMQGAMEEVKRRRQIQMEYNQKHGITPVSIHKEIREKLIERELREEVSKRNQVVRLTPKGEEVEIAQIHKNDFTPEDLLLLSKRLRKAMLAAAKDLDFEKAAKIRDKIRELQS